jgi:hypothetical protein
MPSFEELFLQSKGKPISFNGQTLLLLDRFQIGDGAYLRVRFEKTNGPWKQGITLTTDGAFELNGKEINKSIVLWSHSAPPIVDLIVRTKKGYVEAHNVWDTGDGVVHAWHNGAAMSVLQEGSVRRYTCNDGHPDENFDDLVFTIEMK